MLCINLFSFKHSLSTLVPDAGKRYNSVLSIALQRYGNSFIFLIVNKTLWTPLVYYLIFDPVDTQIIVCIGDPWKGSPKL